jgi:acylphosphatase
MAGAIDRNADVHRRVVIRGRVQGVSYRAWTEMTALERGIGGWVRNRRDGTVEALFFGPAAAVAAMIEACRAGPPGARVDAIDQRDAGEEELTLRRRGEMFSVLATL